MGDRRELLLAIANLIDDTSIQTTTPVDDLELLKLVVGRAEAKGISPPSDSLAFPQSLRSKGHIVESNELWQRLEHFNNQLRQDYTCRRQMLLRRLDCTVESFKWKGGGATTTTTSRSDSGPSSKQLEQRTKQMNEKVQEQYDKARAHIGEEPNVTMAHLLAIRESDCDKILNSVISSHVSDCKIAYDKASKQTGDHLVSLKQVIIPHVPDRGGRPGEVRPPPKETFGQQRGNFRGNRSSGSGGGGGGGNRRGHGRR